MVGRLTSKDLNKLRNADVLLFRRPPFPSFGYWIAKYTSSKYSHVGLVEMEDNTPYVVEFREFKGGRRILLQKYLFERYNIDVFRALPCLRFPNQEKNLHFTGEIANNIIKDAKTLIGKQYSWSNIWTIMKTYIPFMRLFTNGDKFKDKEKLSEFVCSTLVTYEFRKYFVDPVPYLSDIYTTPGDIANSILFKKIYEL